MAFADADRPCVQLGLKVSANIVVLQPGFPDQKHQRLVFELLLKGNPAEWRTAPYLANFRLDVRESRVQFAGCGLSGKRWNRFGRSRTRSRDQLTEGFEMRRVAILAADGVVALTVVMKKSTVYG